MLYSTYKLASAKVERLFEIEGHSPAFSPFSPSSPRTERFDERLRVYQDICEHFKPVFQHFFLEKFHNPGMWFERRMAYAHSLATTSIIGYVLGIGDRHISNILIDVKTAELIHIDFGIAFEQGKCLVSPETIPFRLTRDLVAALGSSGVEGVFRRSCEHTMEVLRHNKQTIVTIIEVLLHDPLYTWTLSSSEVARRQETSIRIDDGWYIRARLPYVMHFSTFSLCFFFFCFGMPQNKT